MEEGERERRVRVRDERDEKEKEQRAVAGLWWRRPPPPFFLGNACKDSGTQKRAKHGASTISVVGEPARHVAMGGCVTWSAPVLAA